MRIAIFLSGQVRTWRRCVASQKALFPGHEVDFYLQAWGPLSYEELISAYSPKEYLWEFSPIFRATIIERMLPTKDFTIGPGTPGRAKSMLSQWLGVYNSWKLAEGRQYDIFVRLRYDALFREPLPMLLEGLGLDDCSVPFWRDDQNGVNDHFAVMGLNAAKHYFGMFEFLINRTKQPRHLKTMFHFTRNLEQCLKQGGVDITEVAIPYLIIRPHFTHVSNYGEMRKGIYERNEGATFASIIRRNHKM